jgi:hypothetical protein
MGNPVLHLFRRYPSKLTDSLLTAMQSFETTLFSLSLERFPHALTSCVSALENLLRGFSGPHTRLEVLLRELWLTGHPNWRGIRTSFGRCGTGSSTAGSATRTIAFRRPCLSGRDSTYRTRFQARFTRNVLNDDDRADEIEDESLDDGAEGSRSSKSTCRTSNGPKKGP